MINAPVGFFIVQRMTYDIVFTHGLCSTNYYVVQIYRFINCILPAISCWRRQWHPTPALLPGKSHGWRSLVGCSPWGRSELDRTQRLHFHFSLSCIGEGNGNPLQCSCLENPRDRGASWAAVYGVAQSQTRLKRLSSSSSYIMYIVIYLQYLSINHHI